MTAHDGAQVTFVESYAQPQSSRSMDDDDAARTRKLAQLRPSLVIAGDTKALEVVRTVHSPTAAAQSPRAAGAHSPLAKTKRRCSFSEALDSAVQQVVETSQTCSSKWQLVWRTKLVERSSGRTDFLASLAVLLMTIQSYGAFLHWHEDRTDIERFAPLSDPVLPLVRAHDLSAPLFVLVYGSLVAGFVYSFDKPDLLVEFWQTNALVMWVRMIALYLTPLEAPQGMIPLVDPLVHADGNVFVRDLFFSGHTATTYLVFLVCRRAHWRWKALFFAVALATGTMVVVQKTHYTIDVFAAPFFVYTSHGIVQELRRARGGLYDEGNSVGRTSSSKLKGS